MAYTLITDGVDGGWVRSEGQLAGKTRILRVELLPAGGFVAELAKPAP